MRNGSIINFSFPSSVSAWASVVGKKESEGPLGGSFDSFSEDNRFGMDTWEKAESEMQRQTFEALLCKRGCRDTEIDLLFAGDLLNQCVGSAYGLRDFSVPYCGLYGACSTMIEGIGLGAVAISTGDFRRVAAVASSHFCSAERQYRFPLEYGSQRAPGAQWTVTGCGAVLLENNAPPPYVTAFLPGRVTDFGIKDANQMGGAMAPAAVDTLTRFFRESGTEPSDYDMILTGDLGEVGHKIVLEMMDAQGYSLARNYNDCGLMIYANTTQDTHSGGSGCGCSASVLCGCILNKIRQGEWDRVIVIGTGAMMSPSAVLQGQSIPAIAHLILLEGDKKGRKKENSR